MNKIQKKLNKMTKYTFNCFCDAEFKAFVSYRMARSTWREEFNKKYNKEQIIKISVKELWDKFGED